MNEPIKLPPLPMPDGTAYGDNRTIKGHYFMPEKVRAFAALAIEQATADLREQLLSCGYDGVAQAERIDRLCEQLAKAEAERDEAIRDHDAVVQRYMGEIQCLTEERTETRAELARLTTLRPIKTRKPEDAALFWEKSRNGQHWMLVDRREWHSHWTPLPPVTEADK